MKQTKVLALFMGASGKPGGCELYRIIVPFHYMMKSAAWQVGWMSYEDFFLHFKREGYPYLQRVAKEVDIFVFPRTIHRGGDNREAVLSLFRYIRLHGGKIVYEVDDDFTNEYRKVTDGESVEIAQWSDAITVTTPMLAERMTKITGRPAYVLPNMLDPMVWREQKVDRAAPPEEILIALTGSPTHHNDWKVLETVLPRILSEHNDVYLVIGGFHPDYLQNLPRTDYVAALPYELYGQLIRSCDIVLAPVDPNDKFNLSKSPIKCVEGQGAKRQNNSAGAAVIATDHPIYRLAVRHEETGLLTPHTPEDWYAALKRMIEDTQLRQRLSLQGYRNVWKHYDASKQWVQWSKAYRTILSQPAYNV